MEYVQPVGGLANDPYLDANPVGGIEGSPVPAAAIEHPMRELVALITDAGLAPTDASLTQVAAAVRTLMQKQSATVAAAAGTADAITAAYTPVIAALVNGMTLQVRAASANATATPTFTPASPAIDAKTIVKGNNLPLVAGDIAGAGHWVELRYDATLDKWVIANPATGIGAPGISAGAVCYFPANSAPPGWIKANGALLSRTTYAALYAYALASGNIVAEGSWQAGKFSTGDLATTFRIPDGRGEFLRGWDDARGADAGRNIGTAQADDLKSHTHSVSTAGIAGVTTTGGANLHGAANTTGATGGTETRPRNVAMLACIKY